MGRLAGCLGFLLFLFFPPFLSEASDSDLKKELQKNLEQSKIVINIAKDKLSKGIPVTDEINQLKAAAENIKAAHLLVQEQFSAGEDSVKPLGAKAIDRHKTVSQGYQKALEEYLALIDGLSDVQSDISSQISALSSLLDRILPKKKRPIFGSLSYRHINYPAKELNQNPAITPAYKGGNKTVSSEDMKNTEEAPISAEIAAFAQSLNWNPVSIYEYVKNNVETEWYWGCMKGAEETLRQKSGNDCDQATLLAALLRASGYPVRYVRGVIEFFPDIEKAKNLTGINNPQKIAEFLQKAGIPYKTVIAGGRISNIQIEHIWVESYIPYSNYRGAVLDEYGKTWLGLDTSIKVTGYTYNQAADGAWQIASGLRDEYLNSVQTQTPLDYLKGKLSDIGSQQNPKLTADSYKLTRTLVPEVLNILPASLQFTEVKITNEYTSIPDELKHKVKLKASKQNTADSIQDNLFDITLDTMKLGNKPIAISYEPETIEDQQIINSYGGLSNTPAYLVRLRPTLKINGERIAVATDGLPMGADFTLTIEVKSPGTSVQRITNTHVVGNLSVIGIVAQKAYGAWQMANSEGQIANSENKSAEQILYEEAMSYTNRWNQAEDELASLFHLSIARPIPTVVTIGGVIDVTYLLDTPHGFEWKGVFVDADLKAVETVISHELSAISQNDIEKTFMQLSSLQGSILENKIFEDDFKVESISTAKLIQLSHEQNSYELIVIDKSNITTILPTLLLDDNIKEDMQNAVNQNLVVHIPQAISHEPYAISYEDWTGIGYIKENMETGESGWMLSGMIAGGMTAVDKDKWINQDLIAILKQQTDSKQQQPNPNPEETVRVIRIAADYLAGIVGQTLKAPLQVMALDKDNRPVQNVTITFKPIAGGGKVQGANESGNATTDPATEVTVKTGLDGIARAKVTLGEKTSVSPFYRQDITIENETYWELVGMNLVSVFATTQTKGNIYTDKPFEAYGKPAEAEKMVKISPVYDVYGMPNSFAATIWIKIIDKYGNSIAGKNVKIIEQPLEYLGTPPTPEGAINAKLYTKLSDCPNVATLDCPNAQIYDAQDPLIELAGYDGAKAYAILGNTKNTKYTIKAAVNKDSFDESGKRIDSDTELDSADIVFYTAGDYPLFYLDAIILYNFDEKLNIINAGAVGKKFPEMFKVGLFYTEEGYTVETLDNGGYYLKGTGVCTTKPVDGASVEFNPRTGGGTTEPQIQTNSTEGHYSSDFTPGETPGINVIDVLAQAKIQVPVVNQQTGSVERKETNLSDYDAYAIWGVKLEVEPNQIILLNDYGYPVTDVNIKYNIQPANYQYIFQNLTLDIYEKDKNGEESGIGFIQADENGILKLSRGGAKFDPEKTYSIQLVLYRGTKAEILSEKVNFIAAKLVVFDGVFQKTEELRYSNGTDIKKQYQIKLLSGGMDQIACSGVTAKISIRKKDNTYAEVPSTDYPGNYINLTFQNAGGTCVSKYEDTSTGSVKPYFIISNQLLESLGSVTNEIKPLYGGIGNKFKIELFGALSGYDQDMPIEPVGVIVLGIDGLRQDVLYQGDLDKVQDGGKYYVNISDLAGLKQILTGYDQSTEKQSYIMLPEVTAIFPSITFASWASIFTGKQPNETGIVGNEFFARDLYSANKKIIGLENFPFGMVTLDADGGAFKPGGVTFAITHVLPVEFSLFGIFAGADTIDKKIQLSTPNAALQTEPLWADIGSTVGSKYSTSPDSSTRCDKSEYECRTVSMFNQYARGADWWGTPSDFWKNAFYAALSKLSLHSEAALLDESAAGEAVKFINNYFANNNPDKKRKKFPAVFSVYLPGIDHDAHLNGMGGYVNFFKDKTDANVKVIIDALIQQGEFDNKIFIIVADHGHTAMPTGMTYIHEEPLYDPMSGEFIEISQTQRQAEMSCSLKTNFAVNSTNDYDGKNARNAELNNNNLHIWELGEVLKAVGEANETNSENWFGILAPTEIADLNTKIDEDTGKLVKLPYGATEKVENADVVVGLNGPMAHVYLTKDLSKVGKMAELFRVMFKEDDFFSANNWFKLGKIKYARIRDEKIGMLNFSIDKILVRVSGDYCVFDGINSNGTPKCTSTDPFVPTEYVDAWARITGLNNPGRSGDIILIMKDSTTGDAINRYTTGVACKSWHGSLNPSDSYVPFIVSYPGGNKTEMEKMLKKDTVCKEDYSGCKANWKLPDIIKEIITEQYK